MSQLLLDATSALAREDALARIQALAHSSAEHPALKNPFYELWMAKALSAEQVEVHQILIRVSDPSKAGATADAIRGLLERHHPARDWEVTIR